MAILTGKFVFTATTGSILSPPGSTKIIAVKACPAKEVNFVVKFN